jgi:protein-tyrosine-phosphatase
MVDRADLVVLVDPSHARRLRRTVGAHDTSVLILGDLDPGSIRSRRIRDPWGREAEEFERVFARIDRCLEELVRITDPSPASRRGS